jgi:hypothetical protein
VNLSKAAELYALAANQGNEQVKAALAQMREQPPGAEHGESEVEGDAGNEETGEGSHEPENEEEDDDKEQEEEDCGYQKEGREFDSEAEAPRH